MFKIVLGPKSNSNIINHLAHSANSFFNIYIYYYPHCIPLWGVRGVITYIHS